VPGTAHVLRVSLYLPIVEVKASPKPSQMEAKGIVLSQLRYPVTVLRTVFPFQEYSKTFTDKYVEPVTVFRFRATNFIIVVPTP
jgi:hypothetical protein